MSEFSSLLFDIFLFFLVVLSSVFSLSVSVFLTSLLILIAFDFWLVVVIGLFVSIVSFSALRLDLRIVSYILVV